MREIKGWICDTCGELIEKPGDGWVEWIRYSDSDGEIRGRELRLVHHFPASPRQRLPGCNFDQHAEYIKDNEGVNDLPLPEFLDANGLMRLLSLVATGRVPQKDGFEMIKRLHIPGYEHAHRHFDRAISEGVFEPNTPEGYYWQCNINGVLEFLEEERQA